MATEPFVVAVVGTGTDVGKTHVGAALARAFRTLGHAVDAWKPVASGVSSGVGEDATLLAEGAGTPARSPAHVFEPPISPHLAARRAGVSLSAAALAAQARRGGDVLIVETAGGLYSPLSGRETNADLVRALRPDRTLLVAPDRLGVLHDVVATLRAARADGVLLSVVALSAVASPDASSGTNAEELRRLVDLPVVEIPRAPAFSDVAVAAAQGVVAALGR